MARRTLAQKLLPLAERFATQIARVVEQDTRRSVAAEVRQRLRSFRSGTTAPRTTRKILVECPTGLQEPGRAHALQLLRGAQSQPERLGKEEVARGTASGPRPRGRGREQGQLSWVSSASSPTPVPRCGANVLR